MFASGVAPAPIEIALTKAEIEIRERMVVGRTPPCETPLLQGTVTFPHGGEKSLKHHVLADRWDDRLNEPIAKRRA